MKFGRGRKEYFESGTWNSLCARCSLKFKFNELKEEWDGNFVCPDCWERRHPQDFVRGIPETNNVFYSLNESETDIDGGTYEDPVTTVDDTDYTTESDDDTILYNTTLTANRTVTLSTTSLIEGQRIQVYRTEEDNFKVDVGGLADLDVPSACVLEWDGSRWELQRKWTL